MDNIFVLREHIQVLYARYSNIIDKIIQFVFALVSFYLINHNVGFMKVAASPIVTLILSVACAFLPMIMTVIFATILILVHMYTVSLSIVAVTGIIFAVMYIFYLRLTPKMAFIVLITPIAFALKIPYIIPIACGLLAAPVSLVAVICGSIVFFMMEYVKKSAASLQGAGTSGLLTQMTAYVKQVFQNQGMWVVILSFIICFFIVYTLRRQSMDHAWKAAIIAGAVVNIIVISVGDIVLGIHTSYGFLIGGSVAGVIIGLILELFFFAVDYARSELLQYEDDEYYYYVKAIPKVTIATPEKTVKRINGRQETEIIDTEAVRRKSGGAQDRSRTPKKPQSAAGAGQNKSRAQAGKSAETPRHVAGNTERLLLTQSLKDELKLNLKDKH